MTAAVLARPAADGRAEAISLLGTLALLRALTAARGGNLAADGKRLSVARAMARQLGAVSRARGTGLSPDHISLYEAVRIEASQAAPAGRDALSVARPAG